MGQNYEQERVDHRQCGKQTDNKENNEGHGCVNADIDEIFTCEFFCVFHF